MRRFSRIMKKPGSTFHDMCQIGRDIVHRTNYRILPTRNLYPEQFPLPAASLEAKKAILVALSPMLTEAEGQRQTDVRACEEFTRCKVGKGRGRFSSYEYTDFDLQCVVSVEEYERRSVPPSTPPRLCVALTKEPHREPNPLLFSPPHTTPHYTLYTPIVQISPLYQPLQNQALAQSRRARVCRGTSTGGAGGSNSSSSRGRGARSQGRSRGQL